MPVNLQIAGWKAEGLRCPDHEIDFLNESNKIHPVSLIQMPNGTGKTTTLELLRATLSGIADSDNWDRKKILSFKKQRSAKTAGVFQVILLFNERRITLTINFDFELGNADYFTTTPDEGMKEGFHPPRELRRFLNPDFVNFFVFDGELAEQLLSHDHTNAETVIMDLFQLKLFKRLSNWINEYWQHETANKAREVKGLSSRFNTVKMIESRITKLENEYVEIKQNHEREKQLLITKEDKYKQHIETHEKYTSQLKQAEDNLAVAKISVQEKSSSIFSLIRDPHALSHIFANNIFSLRNSLVKAKLPESAAREFFEDLAKEEECVCGRIMDDSARKAIRERAARYMGSEEVALLNAIKSDIAANVNKDTEVHEKLLNEEIDGLLLSIQEVQQKQTDRDAIEAEILSIDPNLENAKEEIDDLRIRVNDLEIDLKKYTEDDSLVNITQTTISRIFGIQFLKDKLEEAEKKLAEITETMHLKIKKNLVQTILVDSLNIAKTSICTEICKDSNQRIDQLMPFNAIRIKEIDKCLVLEGQEGGSVGETLSIGYAFLSTLFNRSEHQLPFIVDSPANPIDLDVRTEVGGLVPKLANQFIAFMISSERESFLDSVEKSVDSKIQYLTLFRKGKLKLDERVKSENIFHESGDGLCINGRNFFCDFQLDIEDNENGL